MTDTTAPKVSRPLIIVLSIVGGLAATFALWTFVISPLLGDDSGDPEMGSPLPDDATAVVQVDEPVEEADDAPTDQDDPLPETFEVFSARDPFQQLVTPPATTAVAAGAEGSVTPIASADPVDGTAPVPDATDGTADEEPTGLPAATVGTTVIRIVDIVTTGSMTRASITVNGQGYEVAEGETFAERFRVLDISGSCATLLFGDSRFTLCKGDEIRK